MDQCLQMLIIFISTLSKILSYLMIIFNQRMKIAMAKNNISTLAYREEPKKKPGKRRSPYSQHFVQHFENNQWVYRCILCQVNKKDFTIKYSHHTAHYMKIHIEKNHLKDVKYEEGFQQSEPDILCSLLLGGISYNQIETIPFFKKACNALQIQIPSQASTILRQQSDKMKSKILKQIKFRKEKGEYFALSFDETILKSKRFLTVILHTRNFPICLALKNVSIKLDEMQIQKQIFAILKQYNLDIQRNILTIICKRGNMNQKFCHNVNKYSTACLAHQIHFSVVNILKKNISNLNENCILEIESQLDSYDGNENVQSKDQQVKEKSSVTFIICKVKRIVKLFIKIDNLQSQLEYALKEVGQMTKNYFVLDIRNRWNSIFLMIERFLYLYPIAKPIVQKVHRQWLLSNQELQVLNNMCQSLREVFICVNRLIYQQTIFSSIKYINDCIERLFQHKTVFSKRLGEEIRLIARKLRQSKIISTISYLSNEASQEEKLIAREFINQTLANKKSPSLLSKNHQQLILQKHKARYEIVKQEQNYDKIKQFFEEQEIALCDQFYQFQDKSILSKQMSELLIDLKLIPSTNIECQRTFNLAKWYLKDRRNRMPMQDMQNKVLLNKYYSRCRNIANNKKQLPYKQQ